MQANEPNSQLVCNFCLRRGHSRRDCLARIQIHNEIIALPNNNDRRSNVCEVFSPVQTNRSYGHQLKQNLSNMRHYNNDGSMDSNGIKKGTRSQIHQMITVQQPTLGNENFSLQQNVNKLQVQANHNQPRRQFDHSSRKNESMKLSTLVPTVTPPTQRLKHAIPSQKTPLFSTRTTRTNAQRDSFEKFLLNFDLFDEQINDTMKLSTLTPTIMPPTQKPSDLLNRVPLDTQMNGKFDSFNEAMESAITTSFQLFDQVYSKTAHYDVIPEVSMGPFEKMTRPTTVILRKDIFLKAPLIPKRFKSILIAHEMIFKILAIHLKCDYHNEITPNSLHATKTILPNWKSRKRYIKGQIRNTSKQYVPMTEPLDLIASTPRELFI